MFDSFNFGRNSVQMMHFFDKSARETDLDKSKEYFFKAKHYLEKTKETQMYKALQFFKHLEIQMNLLTVEAYLYFAQEKYEEGYEFLSDWKRRAILPKTVSEEDKPQAIKQAELVLAHVNMLLLHLLGGIKATVSAEEYKNYSFWETQLINDTKSHPITELAFNQFKKDNTFYTRELPGIAFIQYLNDNKMGAANLMRKQFGLFGFDNALQRELGDNGYLFFYDNHHPKYKTFISDMKTMIAS